MSRTTKRERQTGHSDRINADRLVRVLSGVPTGTLPAARYSPRMTYDVMAPMRDGIQLAMDLSRPEGLGCGPVVLMRTPYNKVARRKSPLREDLVRRGYAVAVQDCRGRFNSDGVFDPYRQEHLDGFDTVEWLAAQPWCDGNVGMIGGSYEGQTQWFAASHAPPALKAIVPTVSPPGHPFLNEPFYGGAMILATPAWVFAMGRRSEQTVGMGGLHTQDPDYIRTMPLSQMASEAGFSSEYWDEWLRHPSYDEYWESHSYEQFWSAMTVPALNVTGWWDMNFLGGSRNFAGMRAHAATPAARNGQRLVIGPWPHWVNRERSLNGVDFGPGAVTSLDNYTIRFLDHWLRGASDNGLAGEAPVHVFVLGANQWWAADDWPLPGTSFTRFYLRGAGQANSHRGDGYLSLDAAGPEPHDEFISDPDDPVHILWTLHDGPVDDRAVTVRPDILCYTSDVLERPLDVVGPVSATLHASSSARDCDWHVRLVDVHPDGAARFLCHGVLRARFRDGFARPKLLQPDRVECFSIDMTATGVRFLPGHRIRVEISSTWFSRFDRNPQTDAGNWMTDARPPQIAVQRVFHDARHPSHICLPVIATPPEE